MNNPSSRTCLAFALSLCGLALAGCVPKIANLSKGETVPQEIVTAINGSQQLLILPLWYEGGRDEFRDPYVITASDIGTTHADVPRRIGFYIDQFVCGGQTKWVDGYLVITDAGRYVYNDFRGQKVSDKTTNLTRALLALIAGEDAEPALLEFIGYEDSPVSFHPKEEGRELTVAFLRSLQARPQEP